MAEKKPPHPVSIWRVIGGCFLTLLMGIGFSLWYTNNVQQQQQAAQRLNDARVAQARQAYLKSTCTILETIKLKYEQFDTPNAQDIADTWGQLETLVGCPKK